MRIATSTPAIGAFVLSAVLLALAACQPTPETTGVAPPADVTSAPAPSAPAPVAPPAPTSSVAPAPEAAASATSAPGDEAVNAAIDRVLGDHAAYQALFTQLQQAVAAKDAAGVAVLVDYPFTTTLDGKRSTLKDAAAFTAQYDRIVTPAIADAIAQQKYADLMVSARGVMLGSGQVWLNGVCRDTCATPDVRVIAIQPGATP